MLKRIKTVFAAAKSIFMQLRWFVKILLILAIVVPPFTAASIIITGKPGFCNSCHVMNPYYDSWERSTHNEVNCLDCHLQPGFKGYIKGKINGLAQAVDCLVGRVGTKANATVADASCMRPDCHTFEELETENINYNGTKFTHKGHIAEVIDGITISCGTCHNHFEGNEHFNVNNEVCFTCHFLKGSESNKRLVQTTCQDCHEVPNRVIKRGLVTIDHAEFVSYQASCDDSCHKRQIEKTSHVNNTTCLNCHSFSKDKEMTSVQLHELHSTGEKVECFACHGNVYHGPTKSVSITAMMDCKNCHSDTHAVQRSIYTANEHPQYEEDKRVLSPMFLTHVECTGCHIEQPQTTSAALDSIGTVARAAPRACDRCHEKGTGEKYVPFWQGRTKKLFEEVTGRLSRLQDRAQFKTNKEIVVKLQEKIRQAQVLLEAVESDGSWGVHNLKYTEAMLMKANQIIMEAR